MYILIYILIYIVHPKLIIPDIYYRGDFAGNNTNEHKDIKVLIPDDSQGFVESIQVKFIYDVFVEEGISLYLII